MCLARGFVVGWLVCCAFAAALPPATAAEEGPAVDATYFEVIKTDDVDGIDLMEDFRHAVFAHKDAGRVSVWDIVKQVEVASIETPSPSCVLARGTCVYVGNEGEGLLSVFDGAKQWQKVAEVKLPVANLFTLSAPGGKAFKGQLLVLCNVDLKRRQLVYVDTKTKVARELGPAAEINGAAVDFDGKFFFWQGAGGSPARAIEGCKSWPMLLAGRNVDLAQRQYDTLPIMRQVQSGPFWIAGNRICKGMPPVPMGDVRDQFVIPDRRKQLAYVFPDRTRLEALELKGTLASLGTRNIYFPKEHGRFIEMNPHVTCFYDFLSFAVTGDDNKLRVYSYDGKQKLVWTLTVEAFKGDDAPRKEAPQVATTRPVEKPGPQKPAADALRTWTDASGKYKVDASFVEIVGDKVKLKRADGKETAVPIAQLSAADQAFLKTVRTAIPLPTTAASDAPATAPMKPAPADAPKTQVLPAVASDVQATAQGLSEDYAKDSAAADAKYKDKMVEVSGLVEEPHLRSAGDVVMVTLTWPLSEREFIMCRLHPTALPHSLQLWPGQVVKLAGTSLGNPIKPMLDDCKFTLIGPPPKTIDVKAETLIDEFTADVKAANEKYAGKKMIVEGFVKAIDKEDQYVFIAGKDGDEELVIGASWGTIHKDKVEAVAKLAAGSPITLRAICGEKTSFDKYIPLKFWAVK